MYRDKMFVLLKLFVSLSGRHAAALDPRARACVANCVPSAGVWESAAPYGTSPTCLTTVPSHTHCWHWPSVSLAQHTWLLDT